MTRNKRAVIYLRVSTGQQQASGLGLEAQKAAIDKHTALAHLQVVESFTETESGRNNARPQLKRALAACRRHRAVLIVGKLDRLARNVAFISALMESGVEFVACDMPEANKLTLHIMAAMAEHEAEMISVRTKAALMAAKARGTVLGGRKVSAKRWSGIASDGRAVSVEVRQQHARDNAEYMRPVLDEMDGLSLREIARRLNEGGFGAPRGGEWTSTQVGRMKTILAQS